MPKRYWWIIITYILCQLSGLLVATPLLNFIPAEQRIGAWTVFSFLVTLIITLWLLYPEKGMYRDIKRATAGETVGWSILGIFLIYVVQIAAGIIDVNLFGASADSQNTKMIMQLASMSPYVILFIVIVGPILEEIIFRKIIFGSLYRKLHSWKGYKALSFWISALVSSLLFAAAHQDGHIIIYGAIGLTLCYLYTKTRRIIVSMIAHGSLNAIAVIVTFSPAIQKMIEEQNVSSFIWGF